MVKFKSLLDLSQKRHNHVFVKLAVSFLLMGIAFRLLVSDSLGFASLLHTQTKTDSSSSSLASPTQQQQQEQQEEVILSHDFPANQSLSPSKNGKQNAGGGGKCDIFTGDWIVDPSGPFYNNESCRLIEDHQNCMSNGRPDSGYLYWRWSPRDCDLPRFDPQRFLNLMRNKSWAFIGDSISRNHVQSLLCILSQVEQPVEVYHDEEYRSKRWHFPSHNFTLSVIWTPFLLKAGISEDNNGVSTSAIQLSLDELDEKWTDQYSGFDYVVIAGGKWFLKTAIYIENNTVAGCHNCHGKNLTELGFEYAYRRALKLVLNFFTDTDHKALIFFRTITPDHFENGEWFSGGTCNRTVPFKEGQIDIRDIDATMRDIELEEFAMAAEAGTRNGVVLRLLDTTHLSLSRPDGHPGPYRNFMPFAEDKNVEVQNDCLHWCLPGPIDSWNDLSKWHTSGKPSRNRYLQKKLFIFTFLLG